MKHRDPLIAPTSRYETLISKIEIQDHSADVQYRYRRSLQMIISQHFSETTVMPGVDVSLQCTLNGPHPGRFVWERDGIVISSNTDSRYTIGQTMAPDSGVITQLNISHLRVDDGGLFSCVAHHGDSVVAHHDRLNVYGLHSNLPAVHHHLETVKPHLLFLTETQIRCPSDAAYLNYPGYSLEYHFMQRAGVCVYVRNDICWQRLRHLEDPDLSTLWMMVDTVIIDWDEMRHFFASYPWQQVCFSSENPSSCAEAISDVVRQAMEYYIPYSDVPVGSSARPWFNADCAEAEKRKHSAFLAWVDARDCKAPDLSSKKRAFNHAANSYKKALRKARFDRISHIGQKLSAQPSGSRAFWSLAKSVEANFCRPTLPPLVRPDGTLAHTAREKAGLFASLFANNSRLDTGSSTPPTLSHCGTSMPEVRIRNKEVLRALCRVDVNKASGPDGPPYIRTLPPFKVQSGRSVTLKCPYYGYPVREITWEYKGKEINTDIAVQNNRYKRSDNNTANTEIFGRKPKLREKRDTPIVNDGTLNIPKVSKTDNGASYSCIVRSPSGEMAKRSFELHVVEAPQLEEILLPTDLQEGQIVQIHCNLKSGDSPVYYSWLKDGKKIPTHLKIVERSLEVFSVLIIKNVSLDHCGTYTCVAANHVAKVNRTVNLYIKVAPKWNEEPQNSSLLLGRGGHISCSANGYPQPQTHWLKKDIVSETWRPVLEVAGGGVLSLSNGSLIFDSVALSDAGLYTCHVENGVGEALSKTVWISVNKPVTFDILSRNMTAKLGQHVTIECQAKGDDPIRIMWTRNGKPINPLTQRVKISEAKSEDGMTSILELLQTETSDGALYQCRAGNPFGADVFSVHLTILEPPAPPSDLSVDSIKSRSVKLSWRDMTRSLAQFYSLQISSSQRLSWNNARVINITRLEELRHSIEVEDLLPATSYTARVAGGNQADLSHFSTPVRFSTTEEAPSSPPLGVQLEQTESPGELRVRWLPPPADTHNGLIIGYRLKAVPQLTGIKETEETSDKTIKTASLYAKQETVVSGLLKGVRYAVSVAAFNSAGSGPFSVPLFQDTREGGK
ncbi:hypothetical protein PYW07_010535 [Mythimna separata]|uniref:Down syndrome cell adhesion molecule-like protein Dscam2 n=1 Tax=Mythimna separata TaxID=271217 RepID=A0AAD7YAB0_MYTSE|nr:hypothetical protein PYW07_010535 [Mythimna separata]